MDDKKSLLTTLPPLLVAVGTLITAVIGLGNFMSSPAPSITEFDVSPGIIDPGGNASLRWAVSGDVTSVSIDPGIGVVALSGSRQISPANTTNYTLTAKNKGQAKTASAQLIVRAAQEASKENISASMQESAALRAPSSASSVGDEPVHNEVTEGKAASNINNANSNTSTGTIYTADKIEKTANDKSAASNGSRSSGTPSKSAGDEFMQMNDLHSTSQSKETIKPVNTTSNSAAGDEPVQMIAPKSASPKDASKPLNSTNQTALAKIATTKATSSSAKASNVGDIA